MAKSKLIIVGDSAFAEVAYEYFSVDTQYEVVAFAVEKDYLKRDELLGRPVVPLETLEERFVPAEHDVYVAIVYSQLNRLRARLAKIAKSKGYRLASYISPKAFIWRNVKIGEHCFIFEDNTVQPFVEIGENVVLWSGNHIGHHSKIGNNCFISSHVVLSGFSSVGANVFMGVNATLGNNVTIGDDCWIGPGVTLTKDVPENTIYSLDAPEPAKVPAKRFFRVKD